MSGSSLSPMQPTGSRAARMIGAGRTEPGDTAAFILSEALPVVPAKLVTKIRSGEYIDMAELLKDNIELREGQLPKGKGAAPHSPLTARAAESSQT